MTSYHISCLLMGDNFDPQGLQANSDLKIFYKQKKGDVGTRGRFNQKLVQFGSAMIEHQDLDDLLSLLSKNRQACMKSGVERILLTITFFYENQCNWEFSNDQLEKIVDLKINLAISCEKIQEK